MSEPVIWRGRQFEWKITDDDATDMTGWTAAGTLRDAPTADGNVVATFAVNHDNVATGQFVLTLTAAETTAITVDFVWSDVTFTQAGLPYQFFEPERFAVRDANAGS